MSGGRFVFGVGNGWNQDEMENHGTDFKSRHKLAREHIEAMKVIWTQDTAEYHGEFVDFGPMQTWPKPVQKPHPPILVGGAFPYSARRAVRYGDGWMPQVTAGSPTPLTELIPRFRQMAAEAGREPARFDISIGGQTEDVDLIKRYRDLDVNRGLERRWPWTTARGRPRSMVLLEELLTILLLLSSSLFQQRSWPEES